MNLNQEITEMLNDRSLSFAERGMLMHLLAEEDFTLAGSLESQKNGEASVRTILSRLIAFGLVHRFTFSHRTVYVASPQRLPEQEAKNRALNRIERWAWSRLQAGLPIRIAGPATALLETAHVYVLRDSRTGDFKIGSSCDFLNRRARLVAEAKPDSLADVFLSGRIPRLTEFCLHDLFATRRLFGEWFALGDVEVARIPELVEEIVRIGFCEEASQ